MKTIRVSEISTYLYCQRAWWYQKSGYESENTAELATGQGIHEKHGRYVMFVGCLRILAIGLLLLSLALFTAYLVSLIL
jgi:hypothetical protein